MITNREFLVRIGKKIIAARKARKLSQKQLADLIPLKPDTLCDMERGQRTTKGYYIITLKSVADALGIEVKDLL